MDQLKLKWRSLVILGVILLAPVSQNKNTLRECGKFCEEIQWVDFDESFHLDTVDRVKRDVAELNQEALRNSPLHQALSIARLNKNKIKNLVTMYNHVPLDPDEVALIMAYTDDVTDNSGVAFYKDLNADCRANGLKGGKYPITKAILRNALIKMSKKSPLSVQILYRREPSSVLEQYVSLLNTGKQMSLKQFTSTSTVLGAFQSPPDYMYTHFISAEVGVSVKPFSKFADEEEVLLPAFYGQYKVGSVDKSTKTAEIQGPKVPNNYTTADSPHHISSTGTIKTSVFHLLFVLVTGGYLQ